MFSKMLRHNNEICSAKTICVRMKQVCDCCRKTTGVTMKSEQVCERNMYRYVIFEWTPAGSSKHINHPHWIKMEQPQVKQKHLVTGTHTEA